MSGDSFCMLMILAFCCGGFVGAKSAMWAWRRQVWQEQEGKLTEYRRCNAGLELKRIELCDRMYCMDTECKAMEATINDLSEKNDKQGESIKSYQLALKAAEERRGESLAKITELGGVIAEKDKRIAELEEKFIPPSYTETRLGSIHTFNRTSEYDEGTLANG